MFPPLYEQIIWLLSRSSAHSEASLLSKRSISILLCYTSLFSCWSCFSSPCNSYRYGVYKLSISHIAGIQNIFQNSSIVSKSVSQICWPRWIQIEAWLSSQLPESHNNGFHCCSTGEVKRRKYRIIKLPAKAFHIKQPSID